MSKLAAGDLHELVSIQVRIDYHVGLAELARERRKPEVVARHLHASLRLHRALRRLEKAIAFTRLDS